MKKKSKFYFPDRTQPHPWGLTTDTFHKAEITSCRNNSLTKQLQIIVFILIPANSCMLVFYSFIIYFYYLFFLLVIQGWNVFMTIYWRQVCIEHDLNREGCGWRVPDRNDWLAAVSVIYSSESLFRITITRNSQLYLLKLLARAVVHLGEWYPYLRASIMWDPQRKKDLFLIETKPLFVLHKILSVLPKKQVNMKPFLSPTKFPQLLPNFKDAVENIWRPTIFCQLVTKSSVPWQLSFAGSSYFANITNCTKNFMCSDANKVTKTSYW